MSTLLRIRPPRRTSATNYQILMVCSSGGHLAQLMRLDGWWSHHRRTWVSFDKPDVRSLLADEVFVAAHHPTTRNLPNLLRNLVLAFRLLHRDRPDVIVSTGAGVAVPFFWIGWLLRIPTAWLEVYDRIDSSTMTGRLVRPVTSAFCVQWEEQTIPYPGATVVGTVW